MKGISINIDHIATLRNARGQRHPDPIKALDIIKKAGANLVTVHLREDRRHIRDEDLFAIKSANILPINLEIAATDEMIEIACNTGPAWVCFVPEKRTEVTTEHGLNLLDSHANLKKYTKILQTAGIKVSLFIDPKESNIEYAKEINADAVEIHTGKYSQDFENEQYAEELDKITKVAKISSIQKLECHAGHGLNYTNITNIANINEITKFHVGHFIIGEAIWVGLENAVKTLIKTVNKV